MLHYTDLPQDVLGRLRSGAAIPAHPLALERTRNLSLEHQRALTRYYMDAGADGVAVGVHTTQFAIHENGMYEPVLELAAETLGDWTHDGRILIAGVTGHTQQAVREAQSARAIGYHAVLLNVARLKGSGEPEILQHCRRVAEEMPVVGFSLLPEAGGFHLSYGFWREFALIDNVIGIKMAPFNRYRTIDIIRAVVDAGAAERVTLITGNDDHIGLDLLVPIVVRSQDGKTETRVRIKSGLLGHWSIWTRTSVAMLREFQTLPERADTPADMLAIDSSVTDCNGAIYDALNDLKGCNPGCLKVLSRQGLVPGIWCLDPNEKLSPGQVQEIDRVCRAYPEMNDDGFVADNLHRWLSDAGHGVPLVA